MAARPKALKGRKRAVVTSRSAQGNGARAGRRASAPPPRPVRAARTVAVRPATPSRAPAPIGRNRAVALKPLSKEDFKEFRKLLEAERQRLSDELEALGEHIPQVEHQLGIDVGGTYDEDFADVAGDTFEREKGFAIESSVQALLHQVEEALSRLDRGIYGTCESCGRPIHPERLRAIPYAKLCIECKAKEERANGRP